MTQYIVEFQVDYPPALSHLPSARMEEALSKVLADHAAAPETTLSVVITDDESVREMNRTYRGVDAATDILSFPADPLPTEIAEALDEAPYLGDLIIAYPYTEQHAQAAGHTIQDELVLLVIHGALHLLGYDHDTPQKQSVMWAKQSEYLSAMGVNIQVPLFTFGDDISS